MDGERGDGVPSPLSLGIVPSREQTKPSPLDEANFRVQGFKGSRGQVKKEYGLLEPLTTGPLDPFRPWRDSLLMAADRRGSLLTEKRVSL
jgi:hypothetical protein